jgi:predicted dehydrogenase
MGFVRLDGDVNMLINATWAEHAQPQQDDIRVELQGTEGTVVLHIRNYRSEDTLRFYTEMQGEPVTVIPGVRLGGPEGHKAMVIDLLSSLKAGSPASTNGQQGLMAVSLLEALYESSQMCHEIAL